MLELVALTLGEDLGWGFERIWERPIIYRLAPRPGRPWSKS